MIRICFSEKSAYVHISTHMGPKHASREKILSMVIFLIFVQKNVYRNRFQEAKIPLNLTSEGQKYPPEVRVQHDWLIIWGLFLGSWTHLGVSRGPRSQKWGPFGAIFGPSLTPPANPVKFFWSKMACRGVPHIVLHVSCWTRTSGGYFWPSEVRFRGILALLSDWFYNGHIENLG